MSKPKFVLPHILTTIVFAVAVVSLLVTTADIRFKSRYELPRRLRLHLNGCTFAPVIEINGESYIYRYFSESTSEEYLDALPADFKELPRKENDLKILEGYRTGLDENMKQAWLPIMEELTGTVYMSDNHPNVALLYFDEERPYQSFSKPNRYYYLIKSELLDATVTYKGHDYEFNFLTHNYTAKDIPEDLKTLSAENFTADNDFLRGQPAYISPKTGMIYIEVFEDTVYMPFERPDLIELMIEKAG